MKYFVLQGGIVTLASTMRGEQALSAVPFFLINMQPGLYKYQVWQGLTPTSTTVLILTVWSDI